MNIPCECGCGEIISNIDVRGRPRRYKLHHSLNRHRNKFPLGSEHPDWKGGRVKDSYGYYLVWNNDPRFKRKGTHYVKEHVLIMERYLGRRLKAEEVVHHINGVKTDNRLKNLKLTSKFDHRRLYHKMSHNVDGRFISH